MLKVTAVVKSKHTQKNSDQHEDYKVSLSFQ